MEDKLPLFRCLFLRGHSEYNHPRWYLNELALHVCCAIWHSPVLTVISSFTPTSQSFLGILPNCLFLFTNSPTFLGRFYYSVSYCSNSLIITREADSVGMQSLRIPTRDIVLSMRFLFSLLMHFCDFVIRILRHFC